MGKIEGNELNALTREILDKGRAEASLSRDAMMRELENYGMAHGTIRAVYYDQRLGTQEFVNELRDAVGRLVDGLPKGASPTKLAAIREQHLRREIRSINEERRCYREAIRAFCLGCANETIEAKATCWNAECELRPVSPLPLRADATSAEDNEEWEDDDERA